MREGRKSFGFQNKIKLKLQKKSSLPMRNLISSHDRSTARIRYLVFLLGTFTTH